MLLDELVGVIDTLKQRIRTHGVTLRANEIRTRVALIDPLLMALGWDVSDPALVTPEYTVGEGRADYALHGSESIPAAMVEAKRLGHNLSDDERMQMLNYANARGVRYAAVTDGDAWEFYEVFKQAPLEDRRLLNLRIVNTPAHELALQLLLLWRPNLASGLPRVANTPLFAEQSASAAEPERITPTPPPVPGKPDAGSSWIPLSAFVGDPADLIPSSIRFPSGDEHPLTNWNQFVRHSIAWLWASKLLKEEDVPIPSSNKRFIVNTVPVHPAGNPFAQQIWVDDSRFVFEGNVSRRAAVSNAKKLLNHCGVDPADVLLRSE